MKRRDVISWTPSSATSANSALGIVGGVLSSGRASNSISTEQSVISVAPHATWPATNYPVKTETVKDWI